MSVRRTFQALRIAVNDEFSALDALLRSLPHCLAPGGRVAMLTFHSGEDRRVKKAFQAGHRAGVYSDVADEVIRSTKEETRANRRASSAKLRWAVRAGCVPGVGGCGCSPSRSAIAFATVGAGLFRRAGRGRRLLSRGTHSPRSPRSLRSQLNSLC